MLNTRLLSVARLVHRRTSWLGIAILTALVVPVATLALSPPTASPGSDTTLEDAAKILTLSGTDLDGDTLSFAIGTNPTFGQLGSIAFTECIGPIPSTCTATVTYTPDPDTNGADSFTFTVFDGVDTSSPATFDVTVTAVNDAPVLANSALSITVLEDAGAPSGAVGSLVSAFTGAITDVDGGSKGIAIVASSETNGTWYYSTNSGGAWTLVGTVSGAQSLLLADSTATRLYFRPVDNYNGTSTSALTIRAWDQSDGGTPATKVSTSSTGGTTAFSTATDVVDAVVTAVNDAPSFTKGANQIVLEDAGAQTVVGWATSLSKGPADESSQTVSFNVSNNNNGLFSAQPAVSSAGTLTYTPAANANGSPTVTISITDNGGVSNGGVNVSANQTFTITVTAVDDPPIAANDVGKIVPKNSSGTVINVLANDTILPDSGETLTITAETNGSHGTVTITGGGTTVTYVPNFAYVGNDSFTYTIKDSGSTTTSDTATVLLDVVQAGTVTRLFGATRYDTSAKISQVNFSPNVPVVYIATGLGFPDALSGAPVAGIKGGPILLVPGTSIPAVIATELTRLRPATIVILGGTGVVSAAVATQLAAYTSGP